MTTIRSDMDDLREGTPRQRAAWRILQQLAILDVLAPFHARLAGTIPIDVDIPGSDLDIICGATDFEDLAQILKKHYGHLTDFELTLKKRYGQTVLLCEFLTDEFPIQVYASPTPVDQQRAWVHMLAEAALLAEGGEEAKEAVRSLKRLGVKTEPAFAQVFGLAGDPYETLYRLGWALRTQNHSPHEK